MSRHLHLRACLSGDSLGLSRLKAHSFARLTSITCDLRPGTGLPCIRQGFQSATAEAGIGGRCLGIIAPVDLHTQVVYSHAITVCPVKYGWRGAGELYQG